MIMSGKLDGKVQQIRMPRSAFLVHVGERLVVAPISSVEGRKEVAVFFPFRERGNLITQASFYINNVVNLNLNMVIAGEVVHSDPLTRLALIKLSRLPPGTESLPVAPKDTAIGTKVAALAAEPIDLNAQTGNLWQLRSGKILDVRLFNKDEGLEGRFVLMDSLLSETDNGFPIMDEQGSLVAVGSFSARLIGPDKKMSKPLTAAVSVKEIHLFLEEYFSKKGGNFKESASRSGLSNMTQNNFRMAIAKALAQMGPDAAPALKPLETALKDPSSGVRTQAAIALGAMGKPAAEAIPELLKQAIQEDKPEVMEQAIAKIGKDAMPALIKVLMLKGTDPKQLPLAIRITGLIGPPAKEALVALKTIAARPAVYGLDLSKAAAEAIERINR